MAKKIRRFSFKGWYKGWFFRSFRELAYVLQLEEQDTPWKSAETAELAVDYIDVYGNKKKHYADFLVDGKIIVEVKPRSYQKSKTVQLKAEAMKEFCAKNNYIYNMISPRRLKKEKIKELIDTKAIQLTDESAEHIDRYLSKRRKDRTR